MTLVIEDVLAKHYVNLLNKALNFRIPDSISKPTSKWIGKQTALCDLSQVAKLNSILSSLEIKEQIDIDKYMRRIRETKPRTEYAYTDSFDIKKIDGKFQKVNIPDGRKIELKRDGRNELTEILVEAHNEIQVNIGKIISHLEKKINELKENKERLIEDMLGEVRTRLDRKKEKAREDAEHEAEKVLKTSSLKLGNIEEDAKRNHRKAVEMVMELLVDR